VSDAPRYVTEEAREASVVSCGFGHLAFRTTFEAVGGCPYCCRTKGERNTAVAVSQAINRRLRVKEGNA
jgi:hypothetical protein